MKGVSFDKLPSAVQHAAVAFAGASLTQIFTAIYSANGVSNVRWNAVLVSAFNDGAVALVGVLTVMWLTPLTRTYGVGKSKQV